MPFPGLCATAASPPAPFWPASCERGEAQPSRAGSVFAWRSRSAPRLHSCPGQHGRVCWLARGARPGLSCRVAARTHDLGRCGWLRRSRSRWRRYVNIGDAAGGRGAAAHKTWVAADGQMVRTAARPLATLCKHRRRCRRVLMSAGARSGGTRMHTRPQRTRARPAARPTAARASARALRRARRRTRRPRARRPSSPAARPQLRGPRAAARPPQRTTEAAAEPLAPAALGLGGAATAWAVAEAARLAAARACGRPHWRCNISASERPVAAAGASMG